MKFLLDANVSWRLVSILKEYFGECVHADSIPELEFPAKDTKIWKYAKDNGYAIITRDNDFNDLISTRGFPPKIIWLRTGNCSRKFTADLLIRSKQAIEELMKSEEYGLLEIF
jgi:predicted nuclease of predicted toxin-antitoxin system